MCSIQFSFRHMPHTQISSMQFQWLYVAGTHWNLQPWHSWGKFGSLVGEDMWILWSEPNSLQVQQYETEHVHQPWKTSCQDGETQRPRCRGQGFDPSFTVSVEAILHGGWCPTAWGNCPCPWVQRPCRWNIRWSQNWLQTTWASCCRIWDTHLDIPDHAKFIGDAFFRLGRYVIRHHSKITLPGSHRIVCQISES